MNKYVEELHNQEDLSSVWNSVLFFILFATILLTIGVVFWSAF